MIDKLRNINFKQPKYLIPAVMVVPFAGLIYFISSIMSRHSADSNVVQTELNMELPEPQLKGEMSDKLSEMDERYIKGYGEYTAIEEVGREESSKEYLDDDAYTETEKEILEQLQNQKKEAEQMRKLQNQLDRSQSRLSNDNYSAADDYRAQMDRFNREHAERMRIINGEPDKEEKERAENERKAREEAERKAKEEADAPAIVVKASETTSSMFNTVSSQDSPFSDSPLIKAMIDQTTKATEGTRLRFKLLDDVVVQNVTLPKGTYLYGVVSGFGDQRVKAKITNILIGSKFLKVDLSVFDNDGMEGFYVPASAFRDFMKQAGSSVAGQSISINNNSSSDGFNAEALAMQALQNIYTAGSQAISSNIRKNKAKIKYNTIVYLINSNQSR